MSVMMKLQKCLEWINEIFEILIDENNEIYYSTASIWEIITKHMAHPEKVIIDGDILA